jgi:hypothetical protein
MNVGDWLVIIVHTSQQQQQQQQHDTADSPVQHRIGRIFDHQVSTQIHFGSLGWREPFGDSVKSLDSEHPTLWTFGDQPPGRLEDYSWSDSFGNFYKLLRRIPRETLHALRHWHRPFGI